ncbi:hypothetical protein OG943_38850 [Amycolatopsis sp. NBC_00345]|uniref:hypothetical protein n=1 Tax=Amycolatopsis sp. NBC_00345 TaxID=2975955 RepID=UPI002E2599CB
MRLRTSSLLGAALLSLLAAATVASPADASPAAAPSSFAAQVRAAGFSAAQARQLQGAMDRDLATLGGRQVAANRIITADRSTITYPLPGEKYAHVLGDGLNGNDPRTPLVLCSYGAFCGWPGYNYSGTGFTHASCGDLYEIPDNFKTGGSWINNQTHNYTTTFWGKGNVYLSISHAAYFREPHANWYPVWYISNNC